MKDRSYRNRWVLVPSLLTLLLFRAPVSWAGQSDSRPPNDTSSPQTGALQGASKEDNDNQSNRPAAAGEIADPEPPHAPGTISSPLFRLTGGLLEGTQSPLRLGPIYLSSAEVLGAYNAFTPADSVANNYSYARTGTLMQANIVLDEFFKNARFTTQWQPRLTIFDGTAYGDIDNVVADLDSNFKLTDRLNLGLSEHFSYFATSLLYGNYFFTTGVVQAPASQQNSFLNAPGHSISNTVLANLSYQISPLTKLSFSPSFNYFHTNTETSLLNSSREGSGTFSLEHTSSEKTAIGLSYSVSVVEFTNGPTTYQYFVGTYSHLFSPNLSFTGSAGLSTYQVSNDPRTWTFTGSATLMKSFGDSNASIAYLRGLYLSDYITTDFTDRVDGQYNRHLGERLTFGVGAGLEKESRVNGFQGNYAYTSLSFRLSRMLSAYARYTYSHQTGDLQNLITGTTNLVVFGLSFQAPRTATPPRR